MNKDEIRFWKHVNKTDTCWEYIGALRFGYGAFWYQGKTIQAHRFSWLLHFGAPNKLILHKCDNPKCVNPVHLYEGTQSDNMCDKFKRGRDNQPKHEQHFAAKLTQRDVIEMRQQYNAGISSHKLARKFNVSQATAFAAITGKTWKNI